MIAEAFDHLGRVVQEQRRVCRFHVVVLRGLPEIVEHQHAVFVGQLEEACFGVLPDPVAHHIEVRLALQAEVRLQPLTRHALAPIVHAPVTALHRNAYTVDADDQMRGQRGIVQLLNCRRAQRTGIQRLRVAAGYRPDRGMAYIDDTFATLAGLVEIDQHTAQCAIVVE